MSMLAGMKKLFAATAGTLCVAAVMTGVATAEPIAIINAEIHLAGPAENPRTIRSGSIIINDGRIVAVGANVTSPGDEFRIIDAAGMPVTPGLFAPVSALGIEEIGGNDEGNDRRADRGFPLSASLNAEDALNTSSSVIPVNAAGGVTRAYTTPDPGGKLFGGCGMVIDLSGSVDPVTKSCVAQMVAMGQAGANRAGDTKAGALALLRYYLNEAKRYSQAPEDYRYMTNVSELTIPDLEALVPYVNGEKPLLVEVESAPDIRRLIEMQREFGLDLVLLSAREAWMVAEELALADIPVIINPLDNLPVRFEAMGATLSNAARLQEKGVRVAFFDSDIGYTHNLRALTQLAGNAVAHGMSREDALAAITLNPAIIWGLEAELGTIQAGKTADIVIWDGDPLELTSRPTTVIIAGEEVDRTTRQSLLARRYLDLSRKDLPVAYQGE